MGYSMATRARTEQGDAPDSLESLQTAVHSLDKRVSQLDDELASLKAMLRDILGQALSKLQDPPISASVDVEGFAESIQEYEYLQTPAAPMHGAAPSFAPPGPPVGE
jgi:hypothetical protein